MPNEFINLDAIKEMLDLIVGSEDAADLQVVAERIRDTVTDEASLEFLRRCWRAKREQLTQG